MNHRSYMKCLLVIVVGVLSLDGIRAQATSPRRDDSAKSVAAGAWGGEHIRMEVSETGAQLEFDCAHGQITQAIKLDRHGAFDLPGTFTPEHGGPVLRDEATPSLQARYSGRVDGDTMLLTITEGKEKLGAFTLHRAARANVQKCR